MKIWTISDLHLAKGVPEKSMEIFGPLWDSYMDRLEASWRSLVAPEDWVLVAGDISWAKRLEEALVDLRWLEALPGKKIVSKGNHDFWWPDSRKKLDALPFESLHFIDGSGYLIDGHIWVGGTRGWDLPYQSVPYSLFPGQVEAFMSINDRRLQMVNREIGRLEKAMEARPPVASVTILMLHYPPLAWQEDPKETPFTQAIDRLRPNLVLCGHLHGEIFLGSLKKMTAAGIPIQLTSADLVAFTPQPLLL